MHAIWSVPCRVPLPTVPVQIVSRAQVLPPLQGLSFAYPQLRSQIDTIILLWGNRNKSR